MAFNIRKIDFYQLQLITTVIFFLAILRPSKCIDEEERISLREQARRMFRHGYDNYMYNAFPADELMPLSCKGRYRGVEPDRGSIDDALGNFSVTLVDSLDTLVIMGYYEDFEAAVRLTIDHVAFDTDVVVSVFETNIRVLGGLLSGHIMADWLQDRGKMSWYRGELLTMAKDLGWRLLPAFNTSTGLPYPRVNLMYGMKSPKIVVSQDTCTACAGTMILEFAALSRLTGEPIFEIAARKAMDYLWHQRHRSSDLVGTVLNIHNGDWIRRDAGVGAGIDSYYEYLFKAYVLLGDETYLTRFDKHYHGIMKYVSQGPLLLDVHMHRPHSTSKGFMDALLAFWPGLQVLKGDIKPAIETHELLYQVMKKHQYLLPEAFTSTDFQVYWGQHFLRPEFIESTYFLYTATGDRHYLEVGKQVMVALEKFARTDCGYAAVSDVRTGIQEDRMDSFVLAETFKYLYLLFAKKSEVDLDVDNFVFTTEAHLLPLSLALHSNRTSVSGPKWFKPSVTSYTGAASTAADFNQFQMCPNVRYLLDDQNRPFNSVSIRASLKDFVRDNGKTGSEDSSKTCSSARGSARKIKKRQLRIAAEEFTASNSEHVEAVKKMGISVVMLPDGRVQLIHQSTSAVSDEDADDGALFMQDMIAISKQQLAKAEEQLRIISFTSPKTGVKINVAAGPAQFGPDLNALGTSVTATAIKVDPLNGCDWPLSDETVQLMDNRIGIVLRGDCMFVQKARSIQKLGGIGVIVIDNNDQTSSSDAPMFAMSGDGSNDVNIPVLFLYGKEGSTLLQLLREYPEMIVHMEPSTPSQIEVSSTVSSQGKAEISEDYTYGIGGWTRFDRDDEHQEGQGLGGDVLVKIDDHTSDDLSERISKIPKLELAKVVNNMAGQLSEKYIKSLKNLASNQPKFAESGHSGEDVYKKFIRSSIVAFKEVIDEKKYNFLEPVLTNLIKSFSSLTEAQAKLNSWLNELKQDKFQSQRSTNPHHYPASFIEYILSGRTRSV